MKVIETEEEYEATLARIDDVFGAHPDSPEGQELKVLPVLKVLYRRY